MYDVTARRQGPRQSESQGLRQPGIRLPRRSQTGPDCPHEQLRFQVDVTEKEAEKEIETVQIACPMTQEAF